MTIVKVIFWILSIIFFLSRGSTMPVNEKEMILNSTYSTEGLMKFQLDPITPTISHDYNNCKFTNDLVNPITESPSEEYDLYDDEYPSSTENGEEYDIEDDSMTTNIVSYENREEITDDNEGVSYVYSYSSSIESVTIKNDTVNSNETAEDSTDYPEYVNDEEVSESQQILDQTTTDYSDYNSNVESNEPDCIGELDNWSDLYVKENSTLVSYCTVGPSPKCKNKNSSDMAFSWRVKGSIDSQYVTRINETTIKLTLSNLKAGDVADHLICSDNPKRNEISSEKYSYKLVKIGVAPDEIDLKCSLVEENNLNCSLIGTGNDYHYLTYCESHNVTNCKNVKCERNETRYDCIIPARKFTWNDQLTVRTERQRFGNIFQEYKLGDIFHLAPPHNSNLNNVNPNEIQLSWNYSGCHINALIKSTAIPILHRYKIDGDCFDNHNWTVFQDTELSVTQYGVAHIYTHSFSGLIPYTQYKICISSRFKYALYGDDQWSHSRVINFKTLPTIPYRPPATDMGGFQLLSDNKIRIFWQRLSPFEKNSEKLVYEVQQEGYNIESVYNTTNGSSLEVTYVPSTNHTFKIKSRNDVGYSQNSSEIVIRDENERPQSPIFLKKCLMNDVYILKWEPSDGVSKHKNYTIIVCSKSVDRENYCEDLESFIHVDGSQKSYKYQNYNGKEKTFAISANTETASSGLTWFPFSVSKQSSLQIMKNVIVTNSTNDSSTQVYVTWPQECEYFFDKYEIHYCNVKECKTNEQKLNVSNNETSTTIENLKPDTEYRLRISMVRNSERGPDSITTFTTRILKPSTPTNLNVIEMKLNSIKLRWTPPAEWNGAPKYYELIYMSSENINTTNYYINGAFPLQSTDECWIEKLESCKNYSIKIRGYNGIWSDYSDEIYVKSLGESKVDNIYETNGIIQWTANVEKIQDHEFLYQFGVTEELQVSHIDSYNTKMVQENRCTVPIDFCNRENTVTYKYYVRVIELIPRVENSTEIVFPADNSQEFYGKALVNENISNTMPICTNEKIHYDLDCLNKFYCVYGPWQSLTTKCIHTSSFYLITIAFAFILFILMCWSCINCVKQLNHYYRSAKNLDITLPPGLGPENVVLLKKNDDELPRKSVTESLILCSHSELIEENESSLIEKLELKLNVIPTNVNVLDEYISYLKEIGRDEKLEENPIIPTVTQSPIKKKIMVVDSSNYVSNATFNQIPMNKITPRVLPANNGYILPSSMFNQQFETFKPKVIQTYNQYTPHVLLMKQYQNNCEQEDEPLQGRENLT